MSLDVNKQNPNKPMGIKGKLYSVLAPLITPDLYIGTHELSHIGTGKALNQDYDFHNSNIGDTPLIEHLEDHRYLPNNDDSTLTQSLIDAINNGPIGESIQERSLYPLGKGAAGLGSAAKNSVQEGSLDPLRDSLSHYPTEEIKREMVESPLGRAHSGTPANATDFGITLMGGHAGTILLNLGIGVYANKTGSVPAKILSTTMAGAQILNITKDVLLRDVNSDLWRFSDLVDKDPGLIGGAIATLSAIPAVYAWWPNIKAKFRGEEPPASRTLEELQEEINNIHVECKDLENPELDYNVE